MSLEKRIRDVLIYTAPELLAEKIKMLVEDEVAAEREACAVLAELRDTFEHSEVGTGIKIACDDIADAIRRRE